MATKKAAPKDAETVNLVDLLRAGHTVKRPGDRPSIKLVEGNAIMAVDKHGQPYGFVSLAPVDIMADDWAIVDGEEVG